MELSGYAVFTMPFIWREKSPNTFSPPAELNNTLAENSLSKRKDPWKVANGGYRNSPAVPTAVINRIGQKKIIILFNWVCL